MTNFQGQASPNRLHWLTPERALFFIPVLTSVGAAAALLYLAALPMFRMVRDRQVIVKDLTNKGLEMPQLERDLQQQQALSGADLQCRAACCGRLRRVQHLAAAGAANAAHAEGMVAGRSGPTAAGSK